MTEEQKQKKREYNKKYWAEHKDEIAAKRKTKAARDKYNARQRERYATDPEFRAKQAEAIKRYLAKPENRAKFNAYHREYSQRPEVKAKQRAYAKGYAAGMRRAKADFMKQVTTRVIHEFTKG